MGVKKQIFVGLAAAVMLVLAAGFVSAVCSPYKCDDADNGVFSFALDPAEGYKKLLGRKWDIGECSYPYWKKCGILGSQTCNKNTGLCVEGSSGDATKNCLDRCYGPDKWGNNFVVSMNKLPSGNDCSVPFEGCTYTNCLKCESGKCENAKCGVGGSGGGTGGGGSAITCSFGGTIYSEGQTRCTSDGNQWRCTYSSWVYDGECSGGGSATCPDRCYGPDSNGNVFVLSMNKIPSGSGYHQFTVDGCTYYYYLPCT
ncbi:hypothetical protein KY347_01325, partial [Candidatus Woesearchaeota archaeon]|nr:hypothetical protein [Candidatus Woesearchaeota archaeon]